MAPTTFLDPDPWRWGGVASAPTAGQTPVGRRRPIWASISPTRSTSPSTSKCSEACATTTTTSTRMHRPRSHALRHVEKVDTLPSWRVAAVLHPTENTSFYVMRGSSFNPSADNLTIAVTNFLPDAGASGACAGTDGDDGNRRQGRGAERPSHPADRGVQYRQDQHARPQSAPAERERPRRRGDGARLGGERGGLHHRRLAGDHELCLHARPHHQDVDRRSSSTPSC